MVRMRPADWVHERHDAQSLEPADWLNVMTHNRSFVRRSFAGHLREFNLLLHECGVIKVLFETACSLSFVDPSGKLVYYTDNFPNFSVYWEE